MKCLSCGKHIPDTSSYCLHCGTNVGSSTTTIVLSQPIEWEYKDFIYKFPPPGQGLWVATHAYGGEGFTPAGAKLHFWQSYQREISIELQKWLDEGWQPLGEIGPSDIEIKTSWSHRDKKAGYWIMYLLFSAPTFGLLFLFALMNVTEIAEPTQFVLQMRRPALLHA